MRCALVAVKAGAGDARGAAPPPATNFGGVYTEQFRTTEVAFVSMHAGLPPLLFVLEAFVINDALDATQRSRSA